MFIILDYVIQYLDHAINYITNVNIQIRIPFIFIFNNSILKNDCILWNCNKWEWLRLEFKTFFYIFPIYLLILISWFINLYVRF